LGTRDGPSMPVNRKGRKGVSAKRFDGFLDDGNQYCQKTRTCQQDPGIVIPKAHSDEDGDDAQHTHHEQCGITEKHGLPLQHRNAAIACIVPTWLWPGKPRCTVTGWRADLT